MTKASDNPYPSILVEESTEPSAPAAGHQRLYIDSTTHKLKRTDSSGTDVTIEAAAGIADQGAFTFLDATEAAAPATPASGKVRIYAKTDGRIYSKDDAGTEYGPFDEAGSGGLTSLAPGVTAFNGTGAISTVTLGSAPASGDSVILACDFYSTGGASGISSTNTTWTKVIGPTTRSSAYFEVWVGVVAGGSGGTTITITHSNSNCSARALVIPVTLTPTVGETYDAAAGTPGTHTLSDVTSGNVVVITASNANTGYTSDISQVNAMGVGYHGSVVPLVAVVAESTSVTATLVTATTTIQMVELS